MVYKVKLAESKIMELYSLRKYDFSNKCLLFENTSISLLLRAWDLQLNFYLNAMYFLALHGHWENKNMLILGLTIYKRGMMISTPYDCHRFPVHDILYTLGKY